MITEEGIALMCSGQGHKCHFFCTYELRWLERKDGTGVLQVCWACPYCKKERWDDVPRIKEE